ncbi:MAG: hypothetical protein ABR543_16500 [Gemmatimonadaceae bacterium]
MGYETKCRVVVGDSGADAKVLLETDDLVVRGPIRLSIPRNSISSVSAAGGRVTVTHDRGIAVLELGDAAAGWVERLSAPPKPLLDKLGVTAKSVVSVMGVDDAEFLESLSGRVSDIAHDMPRKNSDLIFFGVENERDLARIPRLAKQLRPDGALWVIHRKGPTGVSDARIFAVARDSGLAYTKVARFSTTHTAEKLVVPKSRR